MSKQNLIIGYRIANANCVVTEIKELTELISALKATDTE